MRMRPADLYMRVGVEHYPSAGAFIAEAMGPGGASKRLPSVPTGAVQDVTRIFLSHPRAIIQVRKGDLDDLYAEVWKLAHQDETIFHAMWTSPYHRRVDILAQVYATRNSAIRALFKRHGVTFHLGIFGYFYLAQLQGVVESEQADLDEALAKADVVPVFVVREGEKDGL